MPKILHGIRALEWILRKTNIILKVFQTLNSPKRMEQPSTSVILTPFNYFEWKPKIILLLRSKGLYRVTMGTEVEHDSAIEKEKYFNRMDESYGILCMTISPYLLFHVESFSTPNEEEIIRE
jgi:hypothetical protein